MTSRDVINIQTQLGYDYSKGSLEEEALAKPLATKTEKRDNLPNCVPGILTRLLLKAHLLLKLIFQIPIRQMKVIKIIFL